MQRRKFLILSVLSAASSMISISSFSITYPMARNAYLIETVGLGAIQAKISKLFSDIKHAQSVGQRFLELHPDQAHLPLLLEGVGESGIDSPSFAVKDVDCLIREDFILGNTVLLDGWVLSRSELNLCAILAIS